MNLLSSDELIYTHRTGAGEHTNEASGVVAAVGLHEIRGGIVNAQQLAIRIAVWLG